MKNRTEEDGERRCRSGYLQQNVVQNRSSIKWSMPLPLMATVQIQQIREERWRANLCDYFVTIQTIPISLMERKIT